MHIPSSSLKGIISKLSLNWLHSHLKQFFSRGIGFYIIQELIAAWQCLQTQQPSPPQAPGLAPSAAGILPWELTVFRTLLMEMKRCSIRVSFCLLALNWKGRRDELRPRGANRKPHRSPQLLPSRADVQRCIKYGTKGRRPGSESNHTGRM